MRREAASEPEFDSDSGKAKRISPRARQGSMLGFCSSLPKCPIASAAMTIVV